MTKIELIEKFVRSMEMERYRFLVLRKKFQIL